MTLELLDRGIVVDGSSPVSSEQSRDATEYFGRIGVLETRLARTEREIDAAQAVRYRVFVEEMHAQLPADLIRRKRDIDSWDAICDHLLVLDRSIEGDTEDQIVGTYRLLRQDVAAKNGGFYSASEFALAELLERHPEKRFMELGRSCVLPQYRTKRTVELLWQGCWAYALKNGMNAMFGCGSFPGTVPEEHALALSFLHHNALVSGVDGQGASGTLPHDGSDAGRGDQCAQGFVGTAAPHQGLFAPWRNGGQRCGDRPRLQHDGCSDRAADLQYLRSLYQPFRC